jgi:hypothetical protein
MAAEMTHTYTGDTTIYGLRAGVDCRIVGRKAGGVKIEVAGGKRFLVGPHQVERRQRKLSARERVSQFVKAAA